MKLNFAIICEHAFVDEEQRLTIVQTFNRIKSDSFPALHPKLAIVTNYTLKTKEEKDRKHTQLIRIHNPSGQIIAELETSTKERKQEENMQFIGYFLNLRLENPGAYKVKIYLDEKFENELDLRVIQKK